MADPFADIPIKGDKLDPFADIPQKKPVDESKPAITFPSPLPKREKVIQKILQMQIRDVLM